MRVSEQPAGALAPTEHDAVDWRAVDFGDDAYAAPDEVAALVEDVADGTQDDAPDLEA